MGARFNHHGVEQASWFIVASINLKIFNSCLFGCIQSFIAVHGLSSYGSHKLMGHELSGSMASGILFP